MKTISAITRVGAFLLAAAACGGCVQSPYTTTDQYRPAVRTVAVPVWTRSKDVYRRDLELRVTEALVKRIELDTLYKVTDKSRADTLSTGRIETISKIVLGWDSDSGLPREKEIVVTVSFRWVNLGSGDGIVHEKGMRIGGTYLPPGPLHEDFFQGSETIVNRIARRVVEQMEAEW